MKHFTQSHGHGEKEGELLCYLEGKKNTSLVTVTHTQLETGELRSL